MFGSRRIAQKIFLGILLPLIFLFVMGLILPLALSSFLGQATRDYEGTVKLVEQVYALRRAAYDTENQLRGFILYRDQSFRKQYNQSRAFYRENRVAIALFVEGQRAKDLSRLLDITGDNYTRWSKLANREFAAADRVTYISRDSIGARTAAELSSRTFRPAATSLDRLVITATGYRDQQLLRATTSENLRRLFTFLAPVFALLAAVLIGRNIAVGITRPIDALTQAAVELEQGNPALLLVSEKDFGEDEIGELGQAFAQMTRTIGQREAVLRSQNDALGAIGRRVEAVLNATNDGIVMLNRADAFSVVNQRFAELFGLEPDVLLDQTFEQAGPLLLSRFKDKTKVRQRFKEILADTEAVMEETFDLVEPVARVVRVYSAPVRGEAHEKPVLPEGLRRRTDYSPDLLGRIFVFRDVTRETMVDRMKTEFVSTVSHELRTPLTAIKGYIDLIVSGQTGEVNEIQQEFLTMVQASTRRLTDLINDMLDISRIESGRIEVRHETVDYVPLVRDAVKMMANEADAKQITLRFNTPEEGSIPTVSGDADRITQVIVNLISNGIKYTPSSGSVIVQIEAEGNAVTTTVADSGIGIAPEDQSRLFQKFFRADNSTTREVGGTGLGLAITKAILDKMRGSIRVESEPGNGSRFIFTLPVTSDADLSGVAAVTYLPRGGDSAAQSRGLVLVIDDSPSLLHLMSQHFRRNGYVISGAMNRSESMRRARDLHPDAITMNIAATKFDPFSLLRSLRAEPATRDIPIVLLSLLKSGGSIEMPGGIDCLPRPLTTAALQKTLAKVPPAKNILVVGDEGLVAEISATYPNGKEAKIFAITDAAAIEQVATSKIHPDLVVLDLALFSPDSEMSEVRANAVRHFLAHCIPLLLVSDPKLLGGKEGGDLLSLAPLTGTCLPMEEIVEQIGNIALRRETNAT